MAFLHKAYTEKSDEAMKYLEHIGYRKFYITGFPVIFSSNDGSAWFSDTHYEDNEIQDKENSRSIDCLGNLELFKAVTALRNDSDYMQWFTNGKDFELCDKQDWADMFSSLCAGGRYNYDRNGELSSFRKATVEELIEKFKK